MTSTYPIKFTAQLRQHLRALRKKRGLTQAQVGQMIGVSQARIAEIEANPGLVSFDQLMQLLAALDVTVSLNEAPSAPVSVPVPQEQINSNTATNSAVEQMHKYTEANRGVEQMRKLTEINSAAEQMRKYTEANSALEQMRKTTNTLSEFSKLQDFLANTKKGSW